jgi:glutaredoxin 3
MPSVTVYTRPFCPYCSHALSVLKKKGVQVTEIEAGFDPALRKEMVARAGGGSTFPQIFIGDQHIGGCDDMLALDRAGQLDKLLSA